MSAAGEEMGSQRSARTLRCAAVLLVLALAGARPSAVAPVQAAPVAWASPAAGGEDQAAGGTIGVYGYEFDPLQGEPKIPAALRSQAAATVPGLYLIQSTEPITDDWLDRLKAAGLVPLQYYAQDAYLVWGTAAQVASLQGARQGAQRGAQQATPAVRWSGAFQPAYKINPGLSAAQGKTENLAITFYNDGHVDATLDRLRTLGTYVRHFPAQPDGAFYTAIFVLDVDRVAEVAAIPTVWAVDYVPPHPSLEDEISNQIVAGNFPGSGSPPPGYRVWLAARGVDGSGVTVADVDTGLDTNDNATVHPDVRGRIAAFVDYTGGTDPTDTNGHGTHTAGIMAGGGVSGTMDADGFLYGQGVAPGARIVVQNAIADAAAFPAAGYPQYSKDSLLNGAIAANNSWGTGASNQGYTTLARTYDLMVRDGNFDTPGVAEPLITVFSAGNAGPNARTITEPKEAKNIISVGASQNYRPTSPSGSWCGSASNAENVATFSSRGPCKDGRICPTIVAPGTSIVSLRSFAVQSYPPGDCGYVVDGQPGYVYMSGTSMAAPQVTGSVALIAQWWKSFRGGAVPSPAMVKALLINGAHDLGQADIPNNTEGWGRVDLSAVIRPRAPAVYLDQDIVFHTRGQTWQERLSVSDPTLPVKITLAWSDAAAGVGARPALVNNLDLTVVHDGETYRGNVFANGWSTTGGTADNLNNTENVFLPAGTTGTLEVTIRAANLAGDGVPYNGDATDQDFALVISNASFMVYLPAFRQSAAAPLTSLQMPAAIWNDRRRP